MKINDFIKEVEKLGIKVTDSEIKKLAIYYEELIKYNTHTNITGITNEEDVYLKHFYDSLTIVKAIDLNKIDSVIDIGTGAGFPGMVIKIFFPHLKITLLDSNGKKTKFLELLVNTLGLQEVTIINDRAEIFAKNNLNKYDICISRAVAFIDIITSLSMPFIKKDGYVLLMKGNLTTEKLILDKYQNELNISRYEIINFQLPISNDERNIVILNKKNDTMKMLDYSQLVKRSKRWNI